MGWDLTASNSHIELAFIPAEEPTNFISTKHEPRAQVFREGNPCVEHGGTLRHSGERREGEVKSAWGEIKSKRIEGELTVRMLT